MVMQIKLLLISILIILTLVSALSVVYVKHYNRTLFVHLQHLEKERDNMQIKWGQLQLEQNTWATHARVDKVAREKLQMTAPDISNIIYIDIK